MIGQCISARLSGSHQIASQSVCASVWLLGLVCGAMRGDNGLKQPSLNYNYVVSLDMDWNVGLGEEAPYTSAY